MGDLIGVLGESSIATVGTVTAYTCPTAKAAKCKIMLKFKANAAGGTILDFYVNGTKVGHVAAMTADFYTCSIKGAGIRIAEQAAEPTGIGSALTVAPADQIYYLSAGDTIQYAISGAAAAEANMQVVGTEIDV
jgi:hypothetical protein